MASTPPTEHLEDWASSGRKSQLSIGKQRKGYNVGEAPGSSHLNYIFNRMGNWNAFTSRALAAKGAFRNMDYTSFNAGGTTVADSYHLDYDVLGDKWYATGVMTNGTTWGRDSDDGETWSSAVFKATPGVGSTGDASKIVTDGSVCAFACDSGGQAKVYVSTDLTVANLDSGNNVGTTTTAVESSDLVYDGSLWIWCGRSTTRGVIYTASDPTGTWTLRKTFAANTDAVALATDGSGNTVCSGSTEFYYSSNGTTWNTATTPANAANNITFAPSLNLFTLLDNASGHLWTSTNGDVWGNQNTINAVPAGHNIFRCPEFFMMLGAKTASTNGIDYCDVYMFHTEALDADSFNYQALGQIWGDALPYVGADEGTFSGGQGKMIFPYTFTGTSSDTRLMVARYGAA